MNDEPFRNIDTTQKRDPWLSAGEYVLRLIDYGFVRARSERVYFTVRFEVCVSNNPKHERGSRVQVAIRADHIGQYELEDAVNDALDAARRDGASTDHVHLRCNALDLKTFGGKVYTHFKWSPATEQEADQP